MPVNLFDQPEFSSSPIVGGNSELGWKFEILNHGLSTGVAQVTLNCGAKKVEVIPTRGMGIRQASNQDVRFGWDSPVKGPVHPMWVPISEPSGIGWLDGFGEMMVRCGLASNGAPEFDDRGQLIWPLHGRIANLPASELSVDVDESKGTVTLRGTVEENRFHIQRLTLKTEITLRLESDEIEIVDKVTNHSDRPGGFQMLYHNNFGAPILEPGSQFFAPVKKLVPRNEHAAAGLASWNQYGEPDASYAEQVYFMELAANDANQSLVVLANKDQSLAASVRYDSTALPCFSLWKNTVGNQDGYVTGLEPATNFPNPRSFEESGGRVVPLAPGESRSMSLSIGMLVAGDSVARAIQEVDSMSIDNPTVSLSPNEWCSK